MNIASTLKALNAYPIPSPLIENIIEGEGLDGEQEATADIRQSKEYKRAKAKVFRFLSTAPNISQQGISYSFTNEDKAYFRRCASQIMDEIGEGDEEEMQYGYIGDNF